MEHNKSISLRISDKLLKEINQIESDKVLDTSSRIRIMLDYAIKKMKEDNLSFKSQEPIIINWLFVRFLIFLKCIIKRLKDLINLLMWYLN